MANFYPIESAPTAVPSGSVAIYANSDGHLHQRENDGTDTDLTLGGSGSGTVTSVGLALPASVFSVSGSPVTGSGTLTGAFANQAANTVFAGPTSGANATPAFRALVADDIPDLSSLYLTIGSVTQYTDEMAQDAIGAMVADTDTINVTYTDGTPELKWDVRVQMSITSDASGLKLSGDATSPGNSKYYGTDSGGTKGWHALATGSGDVVGPSSATDNALARFDGTTGKLIQNSRATLSDDGALTVSLTTITVDSTQEVLATKLTTAGTPAAGFGLVLSQYLKSSTTDDQVVSFTEHYWSTATHASRKGRVHYHVSDTQGRLYLAAGTDGSQALIGFLGIDPPIARQTGDVGTALVAFGLMSGTPTFAAANLTGTALPAAIVTSSLTAVGTIATGVWNGTDIAVADGGTGASDATNARSNLSAAKSGANTDITSVYLDNTGLKIKDTNASHGLTIKPGSNITADKTLTITTGDSDRTITLNGDTTLTGTNTGDQTITLTGDVTGSGTGSFATTLSSSLKTGRLIAVHVLSGSGTFTPNAAATALKVRALGGGGGGGGSLGAAGPLSGAGGGGGGGGYVEKHITSLSASYAYSVGGGGAGGAATPATGSTGGDSTFGASITASGGVGGAGVMTAGSTVTNSGAGGGAGGAASGGDLNVSGSPGQRGMRFSGTEAFGGTGGGSPLGGGGGLSLNLTGEAAGGFGAGGGGSASNSGTGRVGGAGSDGTIIVEEYT